MLKRTMIPTSGLALTLFLAATPAAAQVVYVDGEAAGPVHDGTSWCTAFTRLHHALTVAPPGAMIRIADGRYLPDTTGLPDPRDATFVIPGDLTISGGYAGCGAPDPDERDPFTYITELSGDLAGDDTEAGLDDNAYHVATAAAMDQITTLSGLVIRGGNAGDTREGGGILATGGRLVLSVCSLVKNNAWRGGAIYIEGGELHLFQCRFVGNATSGEGGAIFDAFANIEAHNCLFTLNGAGNDGGAIFCDLCNIDLINCSFGANESGGRGGAIYEYVGVEAYTGNCIFWGNSDMSGSGEGSQIYINPSNILSIEYSCVQGWSGKHGGEGNIGDDPLLVDLPSGDMHLLPDSPCIDSGSNDLVGSQLDLDGNPRIVNGVVDMGCYEFQDPSGLPDPWPAGETPRILSIGNRPGSPNSSVRFLPPREAAWSLAVHGINGRHVDLLGRGNGADGLREIVWDGKDVEGRRVPSGVYLIVLTKDGRLLDSGKSIRLH
jgi:predicted outer membrane repeat protein